MTSREDALADYRAQADLIESERQLGGLTREQAADAMRAARLEYERTAGPLAPADRPARS